MMEFSALIAACLAGACGALAYGYRGQRDMEREQVVYLRKELAAARAPTPPTGSTAVAVPHGPRAIEGGR